MSKIYRKEMHIMEFQEKFTYLGLEIKDRKNAKDLPEEQKELLIHTIEDHTYQINSSKEIIKLIQSLKVKERNKNAKK